MKKSLSTQVLASRLLILTIAFVFTFCGDDDGGGGGGSNNFSYSIDGENQKVKTVSGILRSEIQYDHEGRALYLTAANGTSEMLSVSVSNWDFQEPPDEGILTGEYDATFDIENPGEENPLADCLELTGENEGVTLCDGGLITYILGSDVYFSAFDGETDGSITITKCNADKHTVSGTFSAKIADLSGVEIHTVTGTFENVKYTVQ